MQQSKHCVKKGTHANISKVHEEICKKIVPCPNADCTDTTERQNLQKHLDTCKLTEVACRNGCDVTMKRKGKESQENEDKLHLHMALDKILSMEEKINTMEDRITKVLRVRESFNLIKDRNEGFISSPFYTGPHGYLMHGHQSVSKWIRRHTYINLCRVIGRKK